MPLQKLKVFKHGFDLPLPPLLNNSISPRVGGCGLVTKNTKNVSEKVIYMHFFHSFWKNLHLTENFYTDMSVVSVTNKRYGYSIIVLFSF